MAMDQHPECSVKVWRGYGVGNRCGRRAKGQLKSGQPACGLHLRGERTRIENDNQRAAEHAERQRLLDNAQAICDRLAWHGVKARARSDGSVVMSAEAADELAQRFESEA